MLNILNYSALKKLIFIVFSISVMPSFASETIQSGRPGQAIGAGTLDPGYIQIQSGYDYFNSSSEVEFSDSLFSNVIRLGLNPIFELSAVLNFTKRNFSTDGVEDVKGLSALHLGFRSRVIKKQKGFIPQMVIQTRFKLKSVNSDFRSENTTPAFTLAAFNKINDEYSITTNLGLNFDGNTGESYKFWVLNLSKKINPIVNAFAELYGGFLEGENRVLFDTGFDYLLNSDTKLDISLGYGNNNAIEEFFVSVGVSYRAPVFNP